MSVDLVQSEAGALERLGIAEISTPDVVQLRPSFTEADLQIVIRAAYKQVFGNTYVLESERLTSAESLLRNGSLSVREFVRLLAKSELYRTRFFECASNNRFIELNFKHLLGRAPYDQGEIQEHSDRYNQSGYDTEVDSYIDSDEYREAFGEDVVPYFRGFKSQPGQSQLGYNRLFKLYRGCAGSDTDREKDGQTARLISEVARNLSNTVIYSRVLPTVGMEDFVFMIRDISTGQSEAGALERLGIAEVSTPNVVQLRPNFTEADLQVVIRAAYKQVFGNTYVLESERLTSAESLLRNGSLSVREFIRLLAKSELYKTRFFECASNNRFIELNFKHLLGRAPYDQGEIQEHSDRYNQSGYDTEIDSYIDSDEYREAFGEDVVPYFRGFKSQPGQSQLGYNRLFKLYRGYAGSDTDREKDGQTARLISEVARNLSNSIVSLPVQRFFRMEDFTQMVQQLNSSSDSGQSNAGAQERLGIASVATPNIVELRPTFSESDLQVVIRAAYKQLFGNTYILESDRITKLESLLRNKSISVREFVRGLAKSELYKRRFFECTSNNRFIELNFKHLLGRAPYDQGEIQEHFGLYYSSGYDAEIDSYLDSDEYRATFGENIVPYFRGFKSQPGQSQLGYNRLFTLYGGDASSDTDREQTGQTAKLITELTRNASPTADFGRVMRGDSESSKSLSQSEAGAQERLGITSVSAPDVVQLRPSFAEADLQIVIRAAYKQVFGNTYILESERLTGTESLLRNGSLSVREFVRLLAKSELYRTRFFECASNNRFIELNFKHLLGRAPYSQAEIQEHFDRYYRSGYDTEVDSYIDSDEYREAFGEDIVPYFRGFKSQPGQNQLGYNRLFKLYGGNASSDTDREQTGQTAKLITEIARNAANAIVPVIEQKPAEMADYIRMAQELRSTVLDQSEAGALERLGISEVATPTVVELRPFFDEEDLQVVIRAAYKQVFGNTYILESDRITKLESLLRNKSISVREFVRGLAKSELYKTRFFECTSNNRFIELNFKHLLGRAPYNQAEIAEHFDRYAKSGYGTEVDSYLDSDEYRETFGENLVPYFRGFKYQPGQSQPGYNRMFKLFKGYAGSDTDRALEGQTAELNSEVALNVPNVILPVPTEETQKVTVPNLEMVDFIRLARELTNAVTPSRSRINLLRNAEGQPGVPFTRDTAPTEETIDAVLNQASYFNRASTYAQPEAYGQEKLGIASVAPPTPNVVELRPFFDEEDLQVVIRAAYKQVFGNTYILESDRIPQLESLLRNKSISVREFVRGLAKSELYKTRFFECTSNNRFIELNFKHLLGRAPYNQAEIAEHFDRYAKSGYGTEVDSYIDSDEYRETFGENLVPYFRGFKYQVAQSAKAFERMLKLYKGNAGSDTDRGQDGQRTELTTELAKQAKQVEIEVSPNTQRVADAINNRINNITGLSPWLIIARDLTSRGGYAPGSTRGLPSWQGLTEPAAAPQPEAYGQEKLGIASVAPPTPNVVELRPFFDEEDLQVVIRAAYKQVFGNTYILESDRIPQLESLLRNKSISVREFVRGLAKSELYKRRFFECTSNNRFIELNFKHLLGRAPYSQSEIREHFDRYAKSGYDAEIDSYIDSDEYRETFGENIVPYFRGFKYQVDQPAGAFERMLKLYSGDAGSDTDRARVGQLRRVSARDLLRSGQGIV